jgi:DNA-binding CsgD family transcriptional regulator
MPGWSPPPRTAAHIALCEAEAERARGDPDPELWSVAGARWDALGHPYPAAYARWRHAEALLSRHARSAEAKRTLPVAHATARDLSARPLLQAIEGLAARARIDLADRDAVPAVSASPQALHERLGLTPREFEVLSLVAAGRTNRQIGKALFITEKTASVHVSHILAKLGATSRVEAAAVALRLRRETSPPRNVSAS